MTDLNQEDATMLQGLNDALMHLTNRLLSATEVANQVAELQSTVTHLQNDLTCLSSDVTTYRNRNLDLDAALSAVRKERDQLSNNYNELAHVHEDVIKRLRVAERDRDEAINKQLETEQSADTNRKLAEERDLELMSQDQELQSLRAKLVQIEDKLTKLSKVFDPNYDPITDMVYLPSLTEPSLSGASSVQEAPPISAPEPVILPSFEEAKEAVQEVHPVQATEAKEVYDDPRLPETEAEAEPYDWRARKIEAGGY